MPRRAVLVFAAAVLLIAAALGGYAWMNRHTVAPQGSGVALVGGPFTLTDQEGRRVTEKDFLGRYMLVFFGFTATGSNSFTLAVKESGQTADGVAKLTNVAML